MFGSQGDLIMRNLVRGLVAALLLAALPLASQAGVFVSVTIAPPVLPVYEQPPIPGPGYIWTPGYWAWDGSYYWVPGTWVLAPVGLLWTPGYWGWVDGVYIWHGGYWGPHVGFYGGVNYGFGYGGVGFVGGEWRGGQLYYNRSVTNITNTRITNVYDRRVVNNVTVSHTSFNGGPGGIAARPGARELAAEHERHVGPLQVQTEHRTMAARDNGLRASVNGGRPAIAATERPGVFSGNGVVAAHNSARGGFRTSEGPAGRGYPAQGPRGGNPPGRSEQPRSFQSPPPRTQPRPIEPRVNESRGGAREQPRQQPAEQPREQRPPREQRDEHPPHQARIQQPRPERMSRAQPPQPQRMAHAPEQHPQRQARESGAEHRHG
jgi:hypothetical protein